MEGWDGSYGGYGPNERTSLEQRVDDMLARRSREEKRRKAKKAKAPPPALAPDPFRKRPRATLKKK